MLSKGVSEKPLTDLRQRFKSNELYTCFERAAAHNKAAVVREIFF